MKTDILTGLLYISIGSVFFFYSKIYAAGTAINMGPGYFPGLISLILILLGFFIVVKSVFKK
jgi:hypothetical protein